MVFNMKRKVVNIQIENIKKFDYPDFVDAYASYAEWSDGTILNEEELDELNSDSSIIQSEIISNHGWC